MSENIIAFEKHSLIMFIIFTFSQFSFINRNYKGGPRITLNGNLGHMRLVSPMLPSPHLLCYMHTCSFSVLYPSSLCCWWGLTMFIAGLGTNSECDLKRIGGWYEISS